jgi:hypothetical protein
MHYAECRKAAQLQMQTHGGHKMGNITAQGHANSYNAVTEEVISERRLWTAVLVNAVSDWRTGTLRAQRDAQNFLFNDDQDFATVCSAAGLDWSDFRTRLARVGRQVQMEGALHMPMAA